MEFDSLIERFRHGDKDAFVKLMRIFEKDLYLLAKSILKDEADIKDAVQETVLTVYQKIDTLRTISSFKPWMLKILVNNCKTIVRKKNINYSNQTPERFYEKDLSTKIYLTQCIEQLDEEFRVVITMFYFNDLSYKEISVALDISEGTVKSRLHRAKAQLYEMIQGEVGALCEGI